MADIAKLIYKKNTLYGGESGDIKSSNDTYDDIVFLTQAEYDALPSKNPNTLYSTPEGGPAGFDPSNTKTFYISSTSDLATAQEAYDWYAAGNNPIIVYTPERSALNNSSGLYFFSHYYNGNDLNFVGYDLFDDSASYGGGRSVYRNRLSIIANSSNVVTEIQRYVQVPVLSYLSKSASNGEYTPSNDYDPATKKYVDDKTGGISADHLEEEGLVGELYSMSDKLFIQKTPKLADCGVEDCKVGDVAADTEIHIQRIASGTASNKLKLKVKKVGSPTTTLKVEVRSGVQVTVTANSEAYWYGDSSDILATGSIAYSAITTDWQELEVTLNNAIGGNRGDLLSIVCYQESSGSAVVDADNYYKIACDNTQWSEAFSFVSVNGSTRTRSKLMPYCIGDGLADKLICKASGTIITANFSQYIGLFYPGATDPGTYFTTPDSGTLYDSQLIVKNPNTAHAVTVSMKGIFQGGQWSGGQSGSGYMTDGTTPTAFFSGTWQTTYQNIDTTYTLGVGKTFQVYYQASQARYNFSGSRRNVELSISGTRDIAKTLDIELLPRSSENIGEQLSTTIMGIHTDGNWFDGSNIGTSFQKDTALNLSYNTSGSYTTPCDGFITYDILGYSSSYPTILRLNGVTYISEETNSANKGSIPIKKGVVISCTTGNTTANYARVTFNAYQQF